jgi:hypothetical protein
VRQRWGSLALWYCIKNPGWLEVPKCWLLNTLGKGKESHRDLVCGDGKRAFGVLVLAGLTYPGADPSQPSLTTA